jgi:signal transduction histidine kinase
VNTYFAPAVRAADEQLTADIEFVSRNPVIDGLLNTVSGLFAVLNEQRQVLALNLALLDSIGLDDPEQVLGLRLGEAVGCMHAEDEEAGCGTSRFCSSCGAAIAIVSSLGQDETVERSCAMTIEREWGKEDIYLRVRSCPLTFSGRRLLLLFIQDVTRSQKLAVLERVFYHDINNMVTELLGNSEILAMNPERNAGELAGKIRKLTKQLAKEIEMHKCISLGGVNTYRPSEDRIAATDALLEVRDIFSNHPVSRGKGMAVKADAPGVILTTDAAVLRRILVNMVTNAFEATASGGEVVLALDETEGRVVYSVWNEQPIPEEIGRRIFQRNFSTKPESGRGLGTYSMKVFGEEVLGGEVDFVSSEETGTEFRFSLET